MNNKVRVVVDKGIPFLEGVFESVAEAVFLSPEEINAHTVRDADALFVRTRTQINKGLLAGSRVRFVATATIGYDHIDQDYCRAATNLPTWPYPITPIVLPWA